MGAFAQETTTFTYQGRLDFDGSPANGQFDLRFELFETVAGGGSRIDPYSSFTTPMAIQGLNQKLDEKEARIKALERTVSELKQLVERLTPTR